MSCNPVLWWADVANIWHFFYSLDVDLSMWVDYNNPQIHSGHLFGEWLIVKQIDGFYDC